MSTDKHKEAGHCSIPLALTSVAQYLPLKGSCNLRPMALLANPITWNHFAETFLWTSNDLIHNLESSKRELDCIHHMHQISMFSKTCTSY